MKSLFNKYVVLTIVGVLSTVFTVLIVRDGNINKIPTGLIFFSLLIFTC